LTHASLPYGRPAAAERRMAASIASFNGRCAVSAHFRRRTFGSGDSSSYVISGSTNSHPGHPRSSAVLSHSSETSAMLTVRAFSAGATPNA
jgi:hypothetical protein